MIGFIAGSVLNLGAGGTGGALGLLLLPRAGNFDVGFIAMLHLTHSLSPVLNFSSFGSHLRDISSIFIKARPLYTNPSLEIDKDLFGWLTP